jgi:hypothetical protein
MNSLDSTAPIHPTVCLKLATAAEQNFRNVFPLDEFPADFQLLNALLAKNPSQHVRFHLPG